MSTPSHRRPRTRRIAVLAGASAAAACVLGAVPFAMSAQAAPDLAQGGRDAAKDTYAATGTTAGGTAHAVGGGF
ncbi:hypothetical protein [Streptomyces sp. NPDC051577]|uniref:hypothetical protein n=1 Tax=Streptomyces sp. NPDC051577 TaxID=3155166 RepID=UPI0034311CF3